MEWEKRVLRLFHVTAWGIPPTIAVIAFALKGVGFSGNVSSSGWCWISNNQAWWKMVLWMCITGKAWEIIAYITIPIFYILVKTHIRRQVFKIVRAMNCIISFGLKGIFLCLYFCGIFSASSYFKD